MLSNVNSYSNTSKNFTPLNVAKLRRKYNEKRFYQNIIIVPVFIALALIAVNFLSANFYRKPQIVQATTPSGDTKSLITPLPTIVKDTYPDSHQTASLQLQHMVDEELRGTKGLYGIAIRNLKTGESYYLNEHQKFQSASLYKLWIMAVVYDQIKQGSLHLDDKLSGDIADLNRRFNIASDAAELKEGSVTFTVSKALEEMITNSHNYAALLLSARVGLSKVSAFLETYNMHDSTVGEPPTTTASDMAIFFEKLYRGDFNDQVLNDEMITLLKRQNLNYMIPKYLPSQVKVAHKTGQIFSVSHDAGIIFSEKGDYVFVGLSDSSFYPDAEEHLARISEKIYHYFEGLK